MWGGLTQLPLRTSTPSPGASGGVQAGSRVHRGLFGSGEEGQVSLAASQVLSGRSRPGRQRPKGEWAESRGPFWQHPHRMIWLVKLRLSSLCGRTIEFKMSTSAGIRTRQPGAWTGNRAREVMGRRAGATARPARPCSRPPPPMIHSGWVHGRILVNVCLRNRRAHTLMRTHTYDTYEKECSLQTPAITCGASQPSPPGPNKPYPG